jgi:hypothetical protein
VKSNSGHLFFSLVATGRFISALPASVIRLNGKRLGIKALPFEFPIRPRSDLCCDVEGTLRESGVAAFHRVRPRAFEGIREESAVR